MNRQLDQHAARTLPLDALNLVDRLTRRLKDRNLAGSWEAEQALGHLQKLKTLMKRVIIERYDLRDDH